MYELPPGLDPGEAMLACVGMRPFLLHDGKRIYADEWKEIERTPIRIDELATQLVNGKLPRAVAPNLDYDRMLESFSEMPPQDVIAAIVDDIPGALHGAQSAFIGTMAKAWNYLKAHFPISVEKTLLSSINLRPSDYALGLFEDLLEIIDQPLSVFSMVASGRLTTAQATAVQGIYPSLYGEIVKAIVFKALDKPEDWVPEWERGLAVLLAVPGLDPNLRDQLQTPGPQSTSKPAPQPTPVAAQRSASRIANASQKIDTATTGATT